MTPAPLDPAAAHLLAHDGLLRALIRDLVRDDQAADDVLQDTWITALTRPPRDRGALRSWLVRVATNRARQRGRAEVRRATREHAVARTEALPSTADLVEREARRRAVRDHVLALPEPYRTALVLRYFEGLRPSEIAAREGLPAATVRTHLHRGLDRLRSRLDAEHDGDRRAWTLAFAGLAGPPEDTPAGPPPLVARAPWRTAALAVVACLGVLATGTLLFSGNDDEAASADRTATGVTVDQQPPPTSTGPRDSRRRGPDTAGGAEPGADPAAPAAPAADEADAERLLVRVVDAQTSHPLAGAAVALLRIPRLEPARVLHRATTTDDGRAAVAPDARGTHLRIGHPGHRPHLRRLLRATGEIVCRLEPGVPVTGRVVLADTGVGVPGVRLEVLDEAENEPLDRAVRTDAEGRFALDAVPPNWRFSITTHHPGFAPVTHLDCRAGPGPDIVLVLGAGATLAGRVTDASGAGVPGAEVAVLSQEYSALELTRSWRSAEGQSPRTGIRATCDDDGRYVVRGLPAPGTYVVAAQSPRHRWTESAPVALAPRAETGRADITLGAAVAAVRVRVLRPDGTPAGGAEVDVDELADPPRRAAAFVSTDESGELVLRLEPSENVFEARVGAPGLAPGHATFRVPRAEPVVVQLTEGASLAGRVVDPDGRPIAGAHLSLQVHDWRTKGNQQAESGEDGTFVLRGLPGASATLRVTHAAHQMAVLRDPGPGPLDVTLARAPRFRGRFEPPPSSTAGVRLRVYGRHGGSSERDLPVADDGSFDVAVAGRPGDTVHLLFRVPGSPPVLLRGRALPGDEPADLGPLMLGPGRVLRGTVRDDQGRPLAGVRVTGRWVLDDPEQRPFHAATTFTDARGAYAFDGAPDRLLGISVDQPGWVLRDDTDDTATDVVLTRAGTLQGRLVPPPGTARYGYPHVVAHGLSDGATKRAALEFVAREDGHDAARGRFRAELRPGRYRLVVGRNEEPWQRALERTIEVRAGTTEYVDLIAE